ncbi:hypothetical protein [Pseudofrankia sp. BMG5.36]|uniref:hypothetical protein n=1 Tax=Pseudofrankia sp. BMG5.36 TaxID=1834512 RepID=UPI0008D91079|nr:hypothetical protein [Pseudofrankia sp. BMG5.36]OHV61396.1 hypothetical protein BCD48_39715 [Pseudofrankia sp. BMG5.36]
MNRLSPGELVKYLTGGATALLVIWFGSVVLSQLMLAILPLIFLILGVGAWWYLFLGRRK